MFGAHEGGGLVRVMMGLGLRPSFLVRGRVVNSHAAHFGRPHDHPHPIPPSRVLSALSVRTRAPDPPRVTNLLRL